MFGLFWKKSTPQNEAGEAERPVPPHFEGLCNPAEATDRQLIAALKWAHDWTREPEADPKSLAPRLRTLLSGAAFPRKDFEGRGVLRMALRIIQLSAQRNRAARTARLMPLAVFEVGPQQSPCLAAQEMDRKVLQIDEFPPIPLCACDQTECLCRFRQLTRQEMSERH